MIQICDRNTLHRYSVHIVILGGVLLLFYHPPPSKGVASQVTTPLIKAGTKALANGVVAKAAAVAVGKASPASLAKGVGPAAYSGTTSIARTAAAVRGPSYAVAALARALPKARYLTQVTHSLYIPRSAGRLCQSTCWVMAKGSVILHRGTFGHFTVGAKISQTTNWRESVNELLHLGLTMQYLISLQKAAQSQVREDYPNIQADQTVTIEQTVPIHSSVQLPSGETVDQIASIDEVQLEWQCPGGKCQPPQGSIFQRLMSWIIHYLIPFVLLCALVYAIEPRALWIVECCFS